MPALDKLRQSLGLNRRHGLGEILSFGQGFLNILPRPFRAYRRRAPFILEDKPYRSDKPLLFMHIPKCSGASLREALGFAINPASPIYGFDRVLFGGFRHFASISNYILDTIYLNATDIPVDSDFVAGHFSYSTLVARFPNGQYVTVLREPVSRVLSLWLYWRSLTDEHLQPWGCEWGARLKNARRPLVEFLAVKEIAAQTDNQALRMLLSPHSLIPEEDFIDARHDATLVKEAMARLGRFAFVDLTENAGFEANLAKWLGRPIHRPKLNETNISPQLLKAPLINELTEDAWKLLDARSRLDLILWRAIAENRVSQLAPELLRIRTIVAAVCRITMLSAPDRVA